MGNASDTAGGATSDYPVEREFPCEEINKRSIGKFILKCCGHEGMEDTEDNRLRTLLQGAITHLEKEKPEVWRNAELTFYDKYANCFMMKAGKGENKFLVHLDGRDEIEVICTDREKGVIRKKMGGFWTTVTTGPSGWFSHGSSSSDSTPQSKESEGQKSGADKKSEAHSGALSAPSGGSSPPSSNSPPPSSVSPPPSSVSPPPSGGSCPESEEKGKKHKKAKTQSGEGSEV